MDKKKISSEKGRTIEIDPEFGRRAIAVPMALIIVVVLPVVTAIIPLAWRRSVVCLQTDRI